MTSIRINLTTSEILKRMKIIHLLVTGLVTGLMISQAAFAVSLDDISFSSLPGDKVQVNLKFSEPLADEPVNFTIDNPARIAIDLPGVTLNVAEKTKAVGVGVAHSIAAVEAAGRTRVVINLVRSVPYDMVLEGDQVLLTLGGGAAAAKTTESAASRFSPADSSTDHAINNIDFQRGNGGEGRIIITLSDPSIGINMGQEAGQIVVDFISTTLPSSLDRRLEVVDFATPVKTIDTSPTAGGARMQITTVTDQYDHLAYQTDNVFTIEVRPLSQEEQAEMQKEKFGFTGEKLSLNFQNIEVRAVLSLIADFTGNNLVATDTVGGNVTLRLRNVPWDQALDIILKSKGLGIRQSGNVMMVAPQAEIAARERLELESAKQVEELAPLRTEFIQINYAKASDLATLIQTGGEASLLSERGTVSIDARTNTLIIQDVAASLEAIRGMVTKLDVPVRQVMIESRIVNADESFTKDLGVRFGYAHRPGDFIDSSGPNLTGGVGGTQSGGIVETDDAYQTGFDVGGNEGLLVNLPVAAATSSIGLVVGKIGTYLLQLELSALLAEGRGENIANPKVITADQTQAVIESGVDIPYQEASSSGASTTSFKKAVLSLTVTPQITPDNRVMLDLKVTQDSQGDIVGGIPTINTRNVTTKVLVDDGETVVLGGVYESRDRSAVSKTPFFGDLPALGFLFKKRREEQARQELLIFVTPKILSEDLNI
ncbi:MAG: type IV pilus assembly protein PilQ [Gammaproteobacteria bacterium]|nr:type IV pilus assembly protein PilQ [Gammaproteobacteria bacterium]